MLAIKMLGRLTRCLGRSEGSEKAMTVLARGDASSAAGAGGGTTMATRAAALSRRGADDGVPGSAREFASSASSREVATSQCW